MRLHLLLCPLLLSLGCARSVEPVGRAKDAAPAEDSTALAAPASLAGADDAGRQAGVVDQPLQAGAPDAVSGPEARDAEGPADASTAECRSDSDCTLTLVPEGDCCPRLCVGRAVPVAEGRKLHERQRACEERRGACPDPVCARPRSRPVPMCTGGRCATRMVPMETP